MKQIRLEYQYQQFIEFSLEDYVFFYGGENQWRRKILRTLKRFAKQKALSDLEESVYGDNGIEIFLEEKKLKAKSIDFYFLEDNTSIFQQMNFIKGTLLHQELLYLQDDFDITNQMSNLNDQLLKLENLMNDKLNNYLTNIEPHFLEMNFQDILKYSLSLNYLENGQSLPLEIQGNCWLNLFISCNGVSAEENSLSGLLLQIQKVFWRRNQFIISFSS